MSEVKTGAPAKTFWINIVVPGAGAIPLEVEVPGKDVPTVDDVIRMYHEEKHVAGWTEQGQWADFFPNGIGAIAERKPSRNIAQVKPQIIMPGHGPRLDS